MAEQDREHAELLERVNRELALYGQLTQQTAEQLSYAKTGVKNFQAKMDAATGAVGALASAFGAYNKAVYRGEHGAKAFTEATDKMTEAAKYAAAGLTLLMPGGLIMKAVVGALSFFAVKLIETAGDATKAVGEQYDQVTDAFKGIAQVGAAAGDGMQGVFDSMMKLGITTERASQYVKLMTESAGSFAQMGGTVARGRKQFEETMVAMKPFREQMAVLGVPPKEQSEAIAAYVKQQRMLTLGTKAQMDLSSEAVMRYVRETDMLTRITGANRQEQEKLLEDAMGEEVFQSMIYELEKQGVEGQQKAARYRESVILAEKTGGKEFAKGIRDSLSGFVGVSGESQKVFRASNGAVVEYADTLRNQNLTQEQNVEAFKKLGKAVGENYDAQIHGAQKMGRATEQFGNINYGAIRQFTNNAEDGSVVLAKAEQDAQERDKLLKDRAKLEVEQLDTQIAQQKTVNLGLKAYAEVTAGAATANRKLAEAALAAAEALMKVAGRHEERKTQTLQQATQRHETTTQSALEAADKARAVAADKSATAEQKREAQAAADKAAAESQQTSREQREAYLREANARREKRKAENAARVMGGGAAAAPEAPAAPAGGAAPTVAPRSAGPAPTGGSTPAAPAAGSQRPVPDSHGADPSSSGQGVDPSKQSGLGLKDPLDQVKQAGLKVRPYGDVYQGGPLTDTAVNVAKAIQSSIEGFGQWTGLNDQYHKQVHPRSTHAVGRGLDMVLGYMPTPEQAQKVKAQILGLPGVKSVFNEYFGPPLGDKNQYTTGPHMHIDAQARDGGVFDGPMSGYPVTMHGNEAVIPLKNGSVPVSMPGLDEFSKIQVDVSKIVSEIGSKENMIAESLQQISKDFKNSLTQATETGPAKMLKDMADQNGAILNMLTQLVQAQKDSNSIQTKMLRVAQN